jgi:hypothetical protein
VIGVPAPQWRPAIAARPQTWLAKRQLALDGVVAKRLDLPYEAGERAS